MWRIYISKVPVECLYSLFPRVFEHFNHFHGLGHHPKVNYFYIHISSPTRFSLTTFLPTGSASCVSHINLKLKLVEMIHPLIQ